MPRCLLSCLALFLPLAVECVAQAPTFSASSRLVEITVVATDRKGAPVRDLAAGELTVLDEAQARQVAFFRYEGAPPAETRRIALPAGIYTNRVEMAGGSPRNITALVLDTLNTEPSDQMMVKAQAMQFLKRLAPLTRVAVYQIGREFRVLHEFTGDTESLRAQLRGLAGEPPVGRMSDIPALAREFEEWVSRTGQLKMEDAAAAVLAGEMTFNATLRASRGKATLERLEEIGRHISGIAGRKNVVWISGGIGSFSARPSTMANGQVRAANPAVGEDYTKAIRAAARRLAQAGVALYSVDARGLASGSERLSEMQHMPARDGMFAALTQASEVSGDTRAASGILAETTGGRLIFNTNGFSEGIGRAEADLAGSYSVAFYSDAPADGKWRTVKVESRRPGVGLAYRRGYFAGAGGEAEWNQERLRAALLSPLGESAIRLTAHGAHTSGEVRMTLQIEAGDLTFSSGGERWRGEAEVAIGEATASGGLRVMEDQLRMEFSQEQYRQALERGLPYRKRWKLAPDAHTVRVLVRDKATGRCGTLDMAAARLRD